MKRWVNFARNRPELIDLKYLYIRLGKAAPLLDDLKDITVDSEIEWDLVEISSLNRLHISSTYSEYSATIMNLDIDEDSIKEIRKQFWEDFVWKTEKSPIPLLLIVPNSNSLGSLTKSQIIEALSLIRLTDRAFDIVEIDDNIAENVLSWIINTTAW